MSGSIKSIVTELVEPMLETEGYELVDVEYTKEGKNWFLRVFVDKDGGIDIDDCSKVSEYLSAKLDEVDPIPDSYFLEVSSPGAERPLKKVEDFIKSVGKHVYVTTYEPFEGLKEFEGLLQSFSEDKQLTIQIDKKTYILPLDKVASARLAIVF